jgi:hypothetical protein
MQALSRVIVIFPTLLQPVERGHISREMVYQRAIIVHIMHMYVYVPNTHNPLLKQPTGTDDDTMPPGKVPKHTDKKRMAGMYTYV